MTGSKVRRMIGEGWKGWRVEWTIRLKIYRSIVRLLRLHYRLVYINGQLDAIGYWFDMYQS